jgi:hypothetical protein
MYLPALSVLSGANSFPIVSAPVRQSADWRARNVMGFLHAYPMVSVLRFFHRLLNVSNDGREQFGFIAVSRATPSHLQLTCQVVEKVEKWACF